MCEVVAHDETAWSCESSLSEDDTQDPHGPGSNMESRSVWSKEKTCEEPSALKETDAYRNATTMPSFTKGCQWYWDRTTCVKEKPIGFGEGVLDNCVQKTCLSIGPHNDAALAAVLLGDILRPSDGREHWFHGLSEQELPVFYAECEDLLNSLVPRRQ